MEHESARLPEGCDALLSSRFMGFAGSCPTNWRWLYSKDLGEFDTTICEACGFERLRYVHLITHPAGHEQWVGRECAVKLCEAQADAIVATDYKLRTAAESKRENSIIVEGQHYLTNPGTFALPKGSPILRAGPRARFSVLPFIGGCRVRFNIRPHSRAWVLDPNGEHQAGMYPVASYPTDPLTGEPWGGWPPCEFAALLLRDADRQAITKLTSGKPSSYTITLEKRYKPYEMVTWSTDGAAQWKSSASFLADRASQYCDESQRWRLEKVLCAPAHMEEDNEALIEELLGIL